MKKIILALPLAVLALLTACIEDKGNYDYRNPSEVINISVENIAESYEVVLGENMLITPEVTGYISGREYSYEWLAISNSPINGKYVLQVIGTERDFDGPLTGIPAGVYTLYFKVIDTRNNVYAITEGTTLTVTSNAYSTGWYLLKDVDGKTDVDYVKISTGEIFDNILSTRIGGDYRLEGSPVGIIYHNANYSYNYTNEEGNAVTLTNLSAFVIASTGGLASFNRNDFTPYLTSFQDHFYSFDEVPCKPQFLDFSGGMFLVNNNELYTTSTTLIGESRFSNPKSKSSGNLFPGLIVNSGTGYGFDSGAGKYFSVSNYMVESLTLYDMELDSDYDVVALPRNQIPSANNRTIVVRNVNTGKYYTFALRVSAPTTGTSLREVSATSKLLQATAYASQANMFPFYFSAGNVLYYYDHNSITDDTDFVLNTYPSDEQIVELGHFSTSPAYYIMALTYKSATDEWKLYVHTYTTGDITKFDTEPVYTFTGKGKATKFYYRHS